MNAHGLNSETRLGRGDRSQRLAAALSLAVALGLTGPGALRSQEVRYYEQDGITYRETRQWVPRSQAEPGQLPGVASATPLVASRPVETTFAPGATAPAGAVPAAAGPAGAGPAGVNEAYRVVAVPVTEYRWEAYWKGRWNPFKKAKLAQRLVPHTYWDYRTQVVRYPSNAPLPPGTSPANSWNSTTASYPVPGGQPPSPGAQPIAPASPGAAPGAAGADLVEVVTRVPIARRVETGSLAGTAAPLGASAAAPAYSPSEVGSYVPPGGSFTSAAASAAPATWPTSPAGVGGLGQMDNEFPTRPTTSAWRPSRPNYLR